MPLIEEIFFKRMKASLKEQTKFLLKGESQ